MAFFTKKNERIESTESDLSPEDARAMLALPNDNWATDTSRFVIPKGNTVFIGTVASQVDDVELFGSYAVGGGFQIYVPDPNILKPVP